MSEKKQTSALTIGCALIIGTCGLGFLALLAIGALAPDRQIAARPTPSRARPSPSSGPSCADAEKAAKDLARVGLVTKLDPSLNEAFVDPVAWHTRVNYEQKTSVARALAIYSGCEKHTGINWVKIRDAYSGKTLAEYDYSGFSSKE